MGQVLYRKYRSKSLDEVIGQEHITKSLKHALKTGKIAHAYLFTGPRGIGKTSVARILAHEVNGLPYNDETYLDIIEIDAASNRRIDEIRNLRDKVNLTPSRAKYKVYIIDEVHMLTKEAFNALLKTLEEPPSHVIFILATTESHKLPDTIVSRTQRFSFKPVSPELMTDHLKYIATKEKIKVDNNALNLIALHGEGSFRDSISLLDQLRHQDDKITLKDVQAALGVAPADSIKEIIDLLSSNEPRQLLEKIKVLEDHGYQPSTLAKQIAQEVQHQLVNNKPELGNQVSLKLLRELLDVQASSSPESLLKVILLDVLYSHVPEVKVSPKIIAEPSVQITETKDEPTLEKEVDTYEEKKIEPKKDRPKEVGNEAFNETVWPKVLSTLKEKHNTLYSFVRIATPEFHEDSLTLSFEFKFHQERINEAKNKESIADTIEQITGKQIQIDCVFSPKKKESSPDKNNSSAEKELTVKTDPALDAISNIFGGGEVLES